MEQRDQDCLRSVVNGGSNDILFSDEMEPRVIFEEFGRVVGREFEGVITSG